MALPKNNKSCILHSVCLNMRLHMNEHTCVFWEICPHYLNTNVGQNAKSNWCAMGIKWLTNKDVCVRSHS